MKLWHFGAQGAQDVHDDGKLPVAPLKTQGQAKTGRASKLMGFLRDRQAAGGAGLRALEAHLPGAEGRGGAAADALGVTADALKHALEAKVWPSHPSDSADLLAMQQRIDHFQRQLKKNAATLKAAPGEAMAELKAKLETLTRSGGEYLDTLLRIDIHEGSYDAGARHALELAREKVRSFLGGLAEDFALPKAELLGALEAVVSGWRLLGPFDAGSAEIIGVPPKAKGLLDGSPADLTLTDKKGHILLLQSRDGLAQEATGIVQGLLVTVSTGHSGAPVLTGMQRQELREILSNAAPKGLPLEAPYQSAVDELLRRLDRLDAAG